MQYDFDSFLRPWAVYELKKEDLYQCKELELHCGRYQLVFDHCQTEDNVDFHFASDKNSVKVKFLGGMHLSLDGDVNQFKHKYS